MQKIDKILIGTHNKGKFIEISDLLPKKVEKISPINLDIESPVENGKTFEENEEGLEILTSKEKKKISFSIVVYNEASTLKNTILKFQTSNKKRYYFIMFLQMRFMVI